MKKLLALLCVLAFAATASAEVIDFSNIHLKIDVPAGWTYASDGDTASMIAEDKSCAITVAKTAAEGITAEAAAKQMAAEHKGTEPQKLDDVTYQYTFKNENGVDTVVTVGVENNLLMVISVTGQHAEVSNILGSIQEY